MNHDIKRKESVVINFLIIIQAYNMDWEFDILYAIQSIRTPFLDKVMAFLSTIGDAGVLWIVIGVVLCVSKKYRRGGMQMLSAELLSFIVGNLIIKNMVDRLRPCQIDETVSLIVKIPFDSSFPSGHTLNGITAAVTLMFIDKRMGIPAIVLAVLIAFSRMYNFMHFPTDVLAGAVLGVVSAVFVNFLFKRAGN